MGQSDSKVETSKMQTVTVQKHQKNGSRRNSSVATVSFGISNPSNVAGFISETVWQEVFDTEAVNYCAIGKRDSAILLPDNQNPAQISPLDSVACQEILSKEDANILHSVPDSSAVDSEEILKDQKAENTSITNIRPEGNSNNLLLLRENVNPADEVDNKVLSPQKDTSVLNSDSPLQQNIHSLTNSNTIVSPDSAGSFNQKSTNIDTPIQTEINTIPRSNTVNLNKESTTNNNQVTTTNPTTVIPSSKSCTNFTTNPKKHRPPMIHSESMHLIGESAGNKQRSILSHMPRMRQGRPSSRRNVRFEELVEEAAMGNFRRGKTYSSVRLRKKKSKGALPIAEKAIGPWTMSNEDLNSKSFAPPEETKHRSSVIQERDKFLELLSTVQDNRYENQRYTLKAGSINDPEESNNDEVFEDSGFKNGQDESDSIPVSGSFGSGVVGCTSPDLLTPSIEVSPVSTLEKKPRHSVSLDDLDIRRDEDHRSLSPPLPITGSALTPGRRSMEALKKVMEIEGPYPLLIESPDGGYWIQNGEYESARGEDNVWTAPEISTEHYTVQCDLTALAYGGHFCGQEHSNYIGRDPNIGPVLLSIKFEKDYQGTQVRAILRTQSETIYKVFPSSNLLGSVDIPDYIRYVSSDKITTDKVYKIELPKASEMIRKFDEHPVAKTHKIGVVHQKYGQTNEEEMFGNVGYSESLDEFLTMLGSKVNLKGFEGYRGGLDVTNDQTGEHSVHTMYKDREIMFHVSTLLPHDCTDTQHVQKKRHIGNDIVVIVFQDENTPFCPSAIRSHFIHSYIVVQVEHPSTDHTIYKVAVTAKDEVPQFGPPLPDPAVFQKGPDFREWLLTKILNAEFNCHMAPSFKKLANRTRAQLFLHMIEEITQTMDDVDYPSLTKGMTLASGSDSSQVKNRRRRRKTLGGIFSIKKESPQNSLSTKRKSLAADASRQIYRKLQSEPSSPRQMVIGSTPDLVIASTQKEHSPSDYTVMINGRPSVGHATPDLAELSRVDTKGKPHRRFTAKKNDMETRKRPKRTKSFGGGVALSDYFRKRKDATSPVHKRSPIKRDSSEESSISSSLNLSIPYDLPNVVEADVAVNRQHERLLSDQASAPNRTKSNPTILERKESDLSVSDVRLTLPDKPKMVNAAVQVTPNDWLNPYITSFTVVNSQNGLKVPNQKSQSLQTTPNVLRKAGDGSCYEVTQSARELLQLFNDEGRKEEESKLGDILRSIQSSTQSLERRASSEDREEMVLHRAESTESISTDVSELYDSLLVSLRSLTEDVVRLREQNTLLSQENVKFASQNCRLKEKHRMMKKQLSATQKQINSLQLKLKLYQPNFAIEDDEAEITNL